MSRSKLVKTYLVLLIVLILIFITSLSLGYTHSSFMDIVDIFLGKSSSAMIFIITKIRLPRILACILGGASLAIAGVLLQTLTKNPLADSGILGINTGAGLVIAIMIGLLNVSDPTSIRLMPIFAMVGGFLTILLVYIMSQKRNRNISPARLIITGVGVSTMLSGIMVSIISNLNPNQTTYVVSWLSGKVSGGSWSSLALFGPILIVIWILAYSRSQSLNIMNLNEQTALALGLNLQCERIVTLLLATALASLSVVLIGNITFVGLVAGHITKRFVGGDHRTSIPAAMLVGMIILLTADTIGRVLLVGTGIPTGLVVSVLGAPYFLWLMSQVEK